MDLGAPASYLTLSEGTPVLSSDGERIGVVEHVLADADADVFDGLVVDTGSGRRFVDAPEVAEIHEQGVLLKIEAGAVGGLPEPSENPATMRADPGDVTPDDLGDKLRRAWDLISGKY
jgi:sporulation protein YlmC with PRC-barrel domain